MIALNVRRLLLMATCMGLTACSNSIKWNEEVQLNDGRLIVVNQKRQCASAYTGGNIASCIERDAWLSLQGPGQGVEVVWHENLSPLVLNNFDGKLYLVAVAPTSREYAKYGKPNPPYFGFVLKSNEWKSINFQDIPKEVYNTNLVIDGALVKTKLLTLNEKNSRGFNGDPGYPPYFLKVDPLHVSKFN